MLAPLGELPRWAEEKAASPRRLPRVPASGVAYGELHHPTRALSVTTREHTRARTSRTRRERTVQCAAHDEVRPEALQTERVDAVIGLGSECGSDRDTQMCTRHVAVRKGRSVRTEG